jgi:hypothetical protein
MNTKQLQFSYLAGFVDGEGQISIICRKRQGAGKDVFLPIICVVNTNKNSLIPFVNLFGGKIQYKKHNNIKWKDCYRWDYRGQRVLNVLIELLPYLKVKKRQAEIVSEYIKKYYGNYYRKGVKGTPIKIQRIKEKYYFKLKKLNHKGK